MRVTDTHVYFWEGPFSNWDNCHFTDEVANLKFHNTEQAFMYWKARQFKDYVTCQEIARETDPKRVKALGRAIKNYNDKEWAEVRFDVMVMVNKYKFSQNPYYGKMLTNTAPKILVEASPYDKVWGVGLGQDDEKILDEKNWLGENLLGKALMEVRKLI